ncbi:MAG TPA: hypothetical protein PKC89_13775 [Pyrinomonadaceae bacterium]|nr:hypothetical protein [Pyrinomonadaceae bacterium]
MIKQVVMSLFFGGVFSTAILGQFADFRKPPEEMYISSWRCLGSVLHKQELKFRLGKDVNTFSQELRADNGRKFDLLLKYNPYEFLSLPVWEFSLVDVTAPRKLQMNLLEENVEHLGFAGVIYPRLKPLVIDEKDRPMWGDGYSFPYVKTVRNVRIDDFVVTIAVTDIKWKNQEKGKVSEVDVTLSIEPWRDRQDKDKFPARDCAGESYQK